MPPRATSPALAASLALLVGCAPEATPRAPRAPSIRCASPTEAPLPDGFGAVSCVRVGAMPVPTVEPFPDPAAVAPGARMPVRYASPAAPAGGDGTRERPFTTLAEALASLPAEGGTVALADGPFELRDTLTLRGAVTLVGSGHDRTRVACATAASAFTVPASAALDIRRVGFTHPAGDGTLAPTLAVLGSARLTDVTDDRPQTLTRASGDAARLVAERVTVRQARGHGVTVLDGARATLTAAVIRDGRYAGVYAGVSAGRAGEAVGGRLQVARSLIANNAAGGVVLFGDAAPVGGADCDAADLAASVGDADCLVGVAVQGNAHTGVFVSGARRVGARRVHVGLTRPSTDVGAAGYGDGLFVGAGARVSLDERLPPSDTSRAQGSRLLENARAGALVDQRGAALLARGAVIGSNDGPGVFVQRSAQLDELGYGEVTDNLGVGLGLTPDTLTAGILCDLFTFTRVGAVRTVAGVVTAGDGVSAYGAFIAELRGNEVRGNARFGILLAGAAGPRGAPIDVRDNRGADNAFGLGLYGDTRATVSATRPTGNAAPPATAPPIVDVFDRAPTAAVLAP